MNKIVVVTFVLSSVASVKALTCWTCENAHNDDHCKSIGRAQRCQWNEQACETDIRRRYFGVMITKYCKQAEACYNNLEQNRIAAWPITQCNTQVASSKCTCCCYSDLCNRDLMKCDKPISCAPQTAPPQNGEMYCSNKNMMSSICTYTCSAGFALSGSRTTSCGRLTKWSHPPPVCLPITCLPRFSNLTNGQVTCTNDHNYDSVCRFTCNNNFALVGPDTLVCNGDSDDEVGQWSTYAPVCLPITCEPRYTEMGNGNVSCTNENFVGSRCTFTCINNNFALNGEANLTCMPSANGGEIGRWSFPSPACLPIPCEDAAPNHGEVNCTDGNNPDSQCDFSCFTGFSLSGEDSIRCGREKQLVHPPPACLQITCTPEPDILTHTKLDCTNDNVYDSVCSFACDAGYFLIGIRERSCKDDGHGSIDGIWTAPPPNCLKATCYPEQSNPKDGSVSCTNANNEGSQCKFECNWGYFLSGTRTTNCGVDPASPDVTDQSIVQAGGEIEGVWSDPPPKCIPIICPDQPTSPKNGRVKCTNSNKLKSRCRFKCRAKFARVGPRVTVCRDDKNGDALGKWSADNPVCKLITCPPRHISIGNGTVTCTNENFVGSVCSFACKNNFIILGNSSLTCLTSKGGGVRGRWSHLTPICMRRIHIHVTCFDVLSRLGLICFIIVTLYMLSM